MRSAPSKASATRRRRRWSRRARTVRSPRSPTWRGGSTRRLVNKKALESLAAAGTFDELEPDRAVVFASIEPMLAIANRGASEKASGQNALFGETEADADQGPGARHGRRPSA